MVKVGDTVYGPYSRGTLITYVKEGRILAHTQIAEGQGAPFYRADDHPNLRWDFKTKRGGFGAAKARANDAEPRQANYFITTQNITNLNAFETVLGQSGRVAMLSETCWILRSKLTTMQLNTKLATTCAKDDRFIVINATDNRAIWYNLGLSSDASIRSVWDADLDA